MQVTFVSHICIEILQHVKPLRVSHKRGLCILVASTVFLGDLLFVYFPPPPPPPTPNPPRLYNRVGLFLRPRRQGGRWIKHFWGDTEKIKITLKVFFFFLNDTNNLSWANLQSSFSRAGDVI